MPAFSLQELEPLLPGFQHRGPLAGVMRVDDQELVVQLSADGDSVRLPTADTQQSWTSIRRRGGAHPPALLLRTTTIEDDGFIIETIDPALARTWIDGPVREALAVADADCPYVLTDDRVEVHTYAARKRHDRHARLAASLACAAQLATRPTRMFRELVQATAHLDAEIIGSSWGLDGQVAAIVRRHGIEVVLDVIRRLPGEPFTLARLRTRLRVAGAEHLVVFHDGLLLDRDTIDATVADLVARTPGQRDEPYR